MFSALDKQCKGGCSWDILEDGSWDFSEPFELFLNSNDITNINNTLEYLID